MKKSDEMIRLEKELAQDREFAEKFDAAMKDVAEAGGYKSDAEVMVKAAESLGYDISAAELERMKADMEKMDPEDMEQVAGGTDYCSKDYLCMLNYRQHTEDRDGHNEFCAAAWHCYTAFLHTDNGSAQACWSDYRCILVYYDQWGKPITG